MPSWAARSASPCSAALSLALYRSGVTTGLADLAALPADAAARVRGTLAGALEAADRLPGDGSVEVAAVARDAFTRSYVVAEALGVALLLAAAAGFALLVRRRRAGDASGVEVGPQRGADPQRGCRSGRRRASSRMP